MSLQPLLRYVRAPAALGCGCCAGQHPSQAQGGALQTACKGAAGHTARLIVGRSQSSGPRVPKNAMHVGQAPAQRGSEGNTT